MSLTMQPQEEIRSGSPLKVPDGARILVVCDVNHDTERLKTILQEEGFTAKWTKSMTVWL
jgi:hypothetical protein